MKYSKVLSDEVELAGGLDLVTTPTNVKPGKVISSRNFEPGVFGGYRRIPGIERFDGQARPSDAFYYMVEGSITGSIAVGDLIIGVTSAATAVVIATIDSSNWVVTKVSGTFVAETFNVSGSPQGTISNTVKDGALLGADHAVYKNLAADEYRNDITSVPGSGVVRGVKYYKSNLYAFRDNVGGTACVMHKSTASGWTAITFGQEVQFDTAVGEIFEGDTVTGMSSGASGVVKRALLRTGTWTSAGVGTLVFDSVTGSFNSSEALQVSSVTKATSTTVDTAITLSPGGKFDIDLVNFFGATDTLRMYCADGINEIGEFDGTRWVPIRTGITGPKPEFISGHRDHLFIAMGSTLQHSGIGDPYSWAALTGSSRLALGDDCTGLLPQTGDSNSGALVVTTDRKVFILYGTSSADWNLVTHSPDSGGKKNTLQNIGFAHFLDTKGVTQLVASQAFGGFQLNVLTQSIQPLIDAYRGKEVASCIVRGTNQYRLFFNDGTGIICQIKPNSNSYTVSFGAVMHFDYDGKIVNVIDSTVDENGVERIFAGSNDGYVYELNRGTSLDGDDIAAHMLISFNKSKSYRTRKRYLRTVMSVETEGSVDVTVGYDLHYGRNDPTPGVSVNESLFGEGRYWDSFTESSFTWDTAYLQEIEVDTPGYGDSIAIAISSRSDKNEPFTIHTCTPYFTVGRSER